MTEVNGVSVNMKAEKIEHKHKTYGMNWRNPRKKYTHEPILDAEYCPTCKMIIYNTPTNKPNGCVHNFYITQMLINDAILKCDKCGLYDFRRIDV